MFAFALSRLRTREEADDATQTTFLYAFRSLQRGVAPEHELSWLLKIAENVCRTHSRTIRRRWLHEAAADPTTFDAVPARARALNEVPSLRQALAEIPENQRRAILLREWKGLTYQEIAQEVGVSEAAVESLLVRARRALAMRLEKTLRALLGPLGWARSLFAGGSAKVATVVAVTAGTSVLAVAPPERARPATSPPGTQPTRDTRTIPMSVFTGSGVAPSAAVRFGLPSSANRLGAPTPWWGRIVERPPQPASPTNSPPPAPPPPAPTPGPAAPATPNAGEAERPPPAAPDSPPAAGGASADVTVSTPDPASSAPTAGAAASVETPVGSASANADATPTAEDPVDIDVSAAPSLPSPSVPAPAASESAGLGVPPSLGEIPPDVPSVSTSDALGSASSSAEGTVMMSPTSASLDAPTAPTSPGPASGAVELPATLAGAELAAEAWVSTGDVPTGSPSLGSEVSVAPVGAADVAMTAGSGPAETLVANPSLDFDLPSSLAGPGAEVTSVDAPVSAAGEVDTGSSVVAEALLVTPVGSADLEVAGPVSAEPGSVDASTGVELPVSLAGVELASLDASVSVAGAVSSLGLEASLATPVASADATVAAAPLSALAGAEAAGDSSVLTTAEWSTVPSLAEVTLATPVGSADLDLAAALTSSEPVPVDSSGDLQASDAGDATIDPSGPATGEASTSSSTGQEMVVAPTADSVDPGSATAGAPAATASVVLEPPPSLADAGSAPSEAPVSTGDAAVAAVETSVPTGGDPTSAPSVTAEESTTTAAASTDVQADATPVSPELVPVSTSTSSESTAEGSTTTAAGSTDVQADETPLSPELVLVSGSVASEPATSDASAASDVVEPEATSASVPDPPPPSLP